MLDILRKKRYTLIDGIGIGTIASGITGLMLTSNLEYVYAGIGFGIVLAIISAYIERNPR